MTYADDYDDAEHGRADMTALLHEDPANWPAIEWPGDDT